MSHNGFEYVPWQTALLQRAGIVPSRDTVMLDFGCGAGECVAQFRDAGYRIFGCDTALPADPDPRLRTQMDELVIRQIDLQPNRLPFEDETFDLVFSNQVFEGVPARLQKWTDRFPFLLEVYRAYRSDTHMRVLVFGKKRRVAGPKA
jgi:SAM-dependent methyltransferase